MDQRNGSAKNSTSIEGAAVRACELRLEWRTPIVDRTERVEFLCGASGGPEHGYVLGMARGDLFSMVANCNACSIPDALEARRSCLNLVSVRRFSGGELACRWSSRMPSQLTTVSPQMPTSLAAGSTRCMDSIYHVIPPCVGPARTGFPTRRANSSPTTGRRRKKCCGSRTGKNRPSGLQRIYSCYSAALARTWWQRMLQKIHL